MSLQQYNSLMNNLLKEKCALASLREKIKEKRKRVCWSYKEFGHLACNCRNKREEGKRTSVPQNRFKVLSSKVMKCGVEIRRQEVEKKGEEAVQCFKCRSEGH